MHAVGKDANELLSKQTLIDCNSVAAWHPGTASLTRQTYAKTHRPYACAALHKPPKDQLLAVTIGTVSIVFIKRGLAIFGVVIKPSL